MNIESIPYIMHPYNPFPGATNVEPSELSEADVHTIKVDVLRTRGNHPAFDATMREQLRKMLTELCRKERIRYMQGLHEARKIEQKRRKI